MKVGESRIHGKLVSCGDAEGSSVVAALQRNVRRCVGPGGPFVCRVHLNKLYPVFFLLFSMRQLLTSSSLYTVHYDIVGCNQYRSPTSIYPVALSRTHFLAFYRTIARFFFGPQGCTRVLYPE